MCHLWRASCCPSVEPLVSITWVDAIGVDLRYTSKGLAEMIQCRMDGCYRRLDKRPAPVYPEYCSDCALKVRRQRRTNADKMSTGTQHRLGLQGSGNWCRRGCCDLDNPQTGDCRV